MHTFPVALFGASGYAGIELTHLLARHPRVRVAAAASDRWGGATVASRVGIEGPVGQIVYTGFEETEALAKDCAVALLATPADVSARVAPRLLAAGCKVVDLSGAFRLTDVEHATAHYDVHEGREPRAGAYGLAELFRDEIVDAKLVANPGCYATAAALALAPLLEAGLVERDDVIADAVSGVTGAGRRSTEEYGFVAIDGDVRAYKVLRHQHGPEIAQSLARVAGGNVGLTFTPHLVPLARGILCTTYARLKERATSADLHAVFARAYEGEPFIDLRKSPDDVSLKQVVGTNRCAIGVACEPRAGGRVVVVSAIDNLIKGAAGQAVQNLNLVLGCDESAGLSHLRRFHT